MKNNGGVRIVSRITDPKTGMDMIDYLYHNHKRRVYVETSMGRSLLQHTLNQKPLMGNIVK